MKEHVARCCEKFQEAFVRERPVRKWVEVRRRQRTTFQLNVSMWYQSLVGKSFWWRKRRCRQTEGARTEQEDKLYPGCHLEKPSLGQRFWRMTFPTLNFQCWPWLQAGLFSSLSQQQERSADEAFFRLQLCTAGGELWLKGFYKALQLHSLEGIQFWTPSRIFKWEIIYFIEQE